MTLTLYNDCIILSHGYLEIYNEQFFFKLSFDSFEEHYANYFSNHIYHMWRQTLRKVIDLP